MTSSNATLRSLLRPLAVLLLAGAALVPTACSSAPAANGPAPRVAEPAQPAYDPTDLDAPLPVDSTVRVGTLDNGLRYYVRRNTSPEDRAELWLVVDAGSTLETDEQRGLAHFIEHMAFNGTRRFAHQELGAYLESIGMRFGPDVNAFTGFDETIYTLQVPTDREGSLERGLEILEDWADDVTFDPEEIERERGVLIEEWRLSRGAGSRMIDVQAPVLFSGSRYAERLPIGKLDVLRNASREDLVRFYEDWYRPDLMAVIAVGHFDPRRVESMVRELFGDIEAPADAPPRWTPELPDHEETLFTTFTDPELTGTSVAVYTKLPRPPEGTGRDYRASLVEGLYHRMLNDRLYEVGHRPDPPFLYAFSATDTIVRAAQVDQQEVGVEPGKALEGLRALLTEIERVRRHGFTEGELARTKLDLLRAYEQTVVEREARSSGSFAAEYSRAFLVDEPIPGIDVEVDMVTAYLPTITLDEVEALAGRRTGGANRVILVSAPEAQAEGLPSNEELLATFEQVQALELEPYEDTGYQADLLAEAPEPGEIVERREIAEIGVTEWELSNGATVVLKPTDFRRDELYLVGFSPGGHSTLSDERYLSGSYAADIVALGGLGELDEIALAKALAGQVAEVGPYIDELEEGVRAGGSVQDAETVFQLVHLAMTQPRYDEQAIESFRGRLRPGLESRLADPDQVFVEELFERLAEDHPRRQPLTAERLDEIDPEVALEVYRERFADAGDFTFVVAGSFEPEEVEPLVETYLASLPGSGEEGAAETWRDVGVERPDEPVEFVVERGIEPKASVWLVLHGDASWDATEEHRLRSLGRVLELRLRDVLREDLGAIYGVSVETELSWRPRERYSVSIRFGCAPERARALVERVRETIETFRDEGPPTELVERVEAQQRNAREGQIRANAYWVRELAEAYSQGADPRRILDFEERLDAVTPESLQEAARRYLDWESRVLGILLPEEVEEAAP